MAELGPPSLMGKKAMISENMEKSNDHLSSMNIPTTKKIDLRESQVQ
jgi:hypothetical protein